MFDDVGIDPRKVARHPERPVIHVASGTSGNLCGFRRRKRPVEFTIILVHGGKGDMVKIKVKPHADCIRCNQMFNITILEHFNLGIPRPRAQRTKDDRRPAFLTAHQFGNGVHFLCRKRHNGRLRRKTLDFLGPVIGQG